MRNGRVRGGVGWIAGILVLLWPGIGSGQEAALPPGPGSMFVSGKAVTPARRPAEGGEVRVFVGPRSWNGPTRQRGRFKVEVRGRPGDPVGIFVADRAGHVGVHAFEWTEDAPSAFDVGLVHLEPAAALRIEVDPAVATGLEIRVLHPTLNAVIASLEDPPDGVASWSRMPPGDLRIRAFHPEHGRGEVFVRARSGEETLAKLSLTRRTVTVTVVDAGTQEPIAGAELEVKRRVRWKYALAELDFLPALAVAPTDAEGRARITGVSDDDGIVVRVRAPGYRSPAGVTSTLYSAAALYVAPEATEGEVAMIPDVVVSWPITGEPPAEGTVVRLIPAPRSRSVPPAAGRVEKGRLVVRGFGPGERRAVAVAPDGSRAHLEAAPRATEGAAIEFVEPRAVEVVLEDSRGQPLEGYGIVVRTLDRARRPGGYQMNTDAGGVARFEGIFAERVGVFLVTIEGTPTAVDGWKDRALVRPVERVKVALPPERAVTLRVFVDGEPHLPEELWVLDGGTLAHRIVEDRETQRVTAHLFPERDDGRLEIRVLAPGLLEGAAQIPPGHEGESDIHLESGTRLVALVEAPDDQSGRLSLEHWSGEAWMEVPPNESITLRPPVHPLIRDRVEFGPLPPGRYRVRELASGIVSDSVEIESGTPEIEVALDLVRVANIVGRVSAPRGTRMADVRIIVDVETGAGARRKVPVSREGTFRVLLRWDGPVTLRASHPVLRSVPPEGIRLEKEPSGPVVLELSPQAPPSPDDPGGREADF